MGRNPIGVFLSILTLAITLIAIVVESGLSWGCVGASILATAGWAKYDQHRQNKLPKTQQRPGPKDVPPPKRPEPKAAPGTPRPRPTTQVIKCTQTKKDVRECDCHSRHVRTAKNAVRRKLNIGDPYGVAKGMGGVPTTNNAKPRPSGTSMVKEQPPA